jgi:hypothetical protein
MLKLPVMTQLKEAHGRKGVAMESQESPVESNKNKDAELGRTLRQLLHHPATGMQVLQPGGVSDEVTHGVQYGALQHVIARLTHVLQTRQVVHQHVDRYLRHGYLRRQLQRVIPLLHTAAHCCTPLHTAVQRATHCCTMRHTTPQHTVVPCDAPHRNTPLHTPVIVAESHNGLF